MNPEIRFIIRCEPGKMKKFEVDKYFRRNPPELLDTGNYRTAVVIPAFDELEELPETLRILRCADGIEKCAVIVVVNHPAGHDSRNSLELLKKLQELDVYTIYLPALSGGAGAARKAGMDAFLASQNPEDMEKCVIFSLDADTFVESDYLHKGIPAVLKYGTVTFDFAHRRSDDERQQQAIIRYEAYLRRYVEKLRKAGSPYAFFTVGSAFAVRGDIYLRCGGMKVREAGEDFYFLQAAAKVSGVVPCPDVVVHPSPRFSHRVPFGTGPAVRELVSGGSLPEIPDSAFDILQNVLAAVSDESLTGSEKFVAGLPEKAADFFRREKFLTIWPKVLENLPDRQGAASKAFHEWFDGLKTLRFLHFQADF